MQDTKADLKSLSQATIRVAELQSALQKALKTYCRENFGLPLEQSMLQVQRMLGPEVDYEKLRGMFRKKGVMIRSTALEPLCKLIGRQDIGRELKALSGSLPDRYVSLAHGTGPTITLAYQILEIWQDLPPSVSGKEFASFFVPQHKAVLHIITPSREGVLMLENPKVSCHVSKILAEKPWLNARSAAQAEQIKEHGQTNRDLAELLKLAMQNFPSRESLAEVLEIHRDTLTRMLKGDGSGRHKVQREVLARVRVLLNGPEKKGETVFPEQTASAASPVKEPPGETSTLVEVLTAGNFEPHERPLDDFFLARLATDMDALCKLMNYVSQHKDRLVRQRVQQALGKRPEQLYYALELFTGEFPNDLLRIYDAQRQINLPQVHVEKKNNEEKKCKYRT